MWETILTAVLWFLLGAAVGVTALFRRSSSAALAAFAAAFAIAAASILALFVLGLCITKNGIEML